MKRIVFLFLVMCSLTSSYSQGLHLTKNYLTDEERNYTDTDLDNAFAAPLSKFVGKKWYQGWDDEEVRYWIFNNDKTGAMVNEFTDKNYSAPVQVVKKNTFRWKRNGNDLTITLTPHLDVAFPIESSMSKLSPRVKAEVKKDYATMQEKMREKTYSDYNIIGRITKITNDIFSFSNPGGYSYTGFPGDDVIGFVSKKRFDEIIVKEKTRKAVEEAKKKAEEEEIKRAEEEAKKEAEADDLNKKAYEQAREEKFADAIATIDKAIELLPEDPNYYDSKGEILLNMGDKDGAKVMWDKVVSLDPKYSEKKSTLYLMLFEPIDIDFDSELNTFEEIGGRYVKRKNGDRSVSYSDEDFNKLKEIWQKIADNEKYLTLKQQKRAINIINKIKN